MTYQALAEAVGRTMAVLVKQGMRRGDGAAMLSSNRTEAWIVQAALLILGCRFTPLQAMGSQADHEFVCADAEVRMLVFDASEFSERASAIARRVPDMTLLALGSTDAAVDLLRLAASVEPAVLTAVPEIEDVCWLPYTGGTTGKPKGVILPHRSMVHNAWLTATEFDWPEVARFIACTPISHGAGLMIVPTLLRGGTIILEHHFDPEGFVESVHANRATASFMVPTMLYVLLDHPGLDPARLATLQTIIYGASPISPARLEQALDALGPVFNQLYGQSEAPNTATVLRKRDHQSIRPHLFASCGRPVTSLRVEVHDDADKECSVGDVGEIVIRGPLVMDGYWRRPEQTAETLRNGWLHTGDLAKRDEDGYLYIVDRSKDMIISGGFNVFPREVEDALTAHPAVAAAAVIGVPDSKWGEAVKAIVVLKAGAYVGSEDLIALVREQKGPVYAPKSIEFVDSIPLTSVAKPDKKALRAKYWSDESRSVS
jgi:fatty-acyl-CoA synthase